MLKISNTREASREAREKSLMAVKALPDLKASGFMQATELDSMWSEATLHGQNLAKKFTKLGVLGIGGSSLGPKVIQQFLARYTLREISFFENVDPVSFDLKLKEVKDFDLAHWLIISKSGKTLETLSQLSLILKKYDKSEIAKHFTVVTDPGSNPLSDWAKTHGVSIFNIPKNIGGRYSVLTPVGIIPAAYLGVATEDIRKGAKAAAADLDLVAQAVAQTLTSFEKNEWITVFWGYSDLLSYFGGWIQQLWAESLAKKVNREAGSAARVSTPLPLVGANDQHSILQQVMEGTRDKFVFFMGINSVEESGEAINDVVGLPEFINGQTLGSILRAERTATQQALKAEGVESLSMNIVDDSPKTLGFLFQYFEMVVAATAEALDIDAFDQPGVELGKRLAMQILSNS